MRVSYGEIDLNKGYRLEPNVINSKVNLKVENLKVNSKVEAACK